MTNELCVVSHSGGLDSTTLLTKALVEGKTCLPLNFNYGQKNIVEMTAQQNVWKTLKERFPDTLLDTITIDFTEILGGAIETFQKNRDNGVARDTTGMEYYMPSRNLLFMAMSAVVGEILANDQSISKLSLGLGIHKHSDIYAKDYWDISPEFAIKLSELLSLNDNIDVSIYSPYSESMKSAIVRDAIKLDVPYKETWTCYNPDFRQTWQVGGNIKKVFKEMIPCLTCEACLERSTQAKGICEDINDYKVVISESL